MHSREENKRKKRNKKKKKPIKKDTKSAFPGTAINSQSTASQNATIPRCKASQHADNP